MARWEFVRWVNETKNPDTRWRRVEVTISKVSSDKRRPCGFNHSACTDPDLAKNGRLVELEHQAGWKWRCTVMLARDEALTAASFRFVG